MRRGIRVFSDFYFMICRKCFVTSEFVVNVDGKDVATLTQKSFLVLLLLL